MDASACPLALGTQSLHMEVGVTEKYTETENNNYINNVLVTYC